MSTKINARSPFFIEATEPTVTLGIFDCTTANLLNFAVLQQTFFPYSETFDFNNIFSASKQAIKLYAFQLITLTQVMVHIPAPFLLNKHFKLLKT